jgi:hypothetical protein
MELKHAIIISSAIMLLIVLFSGSGGSVGKTKTDGVYESATHKIDQGIPLTDSEAKRINDIINYKDNNHNK